MTMVLAMGEDDDGKVLLVSSFGVGFRVDIQLERKHTNIHTHTEAGTCNKEQRVD